MRASLCNASPASSVMCRWWRTCLLLCPTSLSCCGGWLLRGGGCLILFATTPWRRCAQAFISPADSHTRLADDPELADACWRDRWIWDLRREPEGLNVGQARAAELPCRRLLAIGTDMAVGKMSACLSLLEAAQRSGIPARFVGTGQAEF